MQVKSISFKDFNLPYYYKSSCSYCPEKDAIESGLHYNLGAIPVIFCLVPQKRLPNEHSLLPTTLTSRLYDSEIEFHNAGMCSMVVYIPFFTQSDQATSSELILPHCLLALETKKIGLSHYLVFECPFLFPRPMISYNSTEIPLKEYICNIMFEIPWKNTFALYLGGKVKGIDMNRCLYNRGWHENVCRTNTTGLLITAHFQNYVSDHLEPILTQLNADVAKHPALLECVSDHLNIGQTFICNPSLVVQRPMNPNVIPTNEPKGTNRVVKWKKTLLDYHNAVMNWIGFVITFIGIGCLTLIILLYSWDL